MGTLPVERTFPARSTTLNYLDCGSPAAEPLVLLHGGAWRWQEYLSLIPSLSRKWHTCSMDLRGHGGSQWVPETYRLRDFVEDNAQFLGTLNSPAVLVGHSLGGVVALMLAARCPDRVKALVIHDVPLLLDNYRRVIDSSREMFALWLSLKRAAPSEQALAAALADASGNCHGITSSWILFFAECLWRVDPTFFNGLLNDFEDFALGYDYRQILMATDCPVLFVRGETRLGAIMTDEEVAWVQMNARHAQCALIPGVGHRLHLEDHGQTPVLAAMLAFLDQQ